MISVVVDFRSGSVITDTILVFDGSSSTTEEAIVNQFNGKLSSVGQLELATGLYFDQVPNTSNQGGVLEDLLFRNVYFISLILPNADVCTALHSRCFPSVCAKKLHRRLGRDSNPRPPAY